MQRQCGYAAGGCALAVVCRNVAGGLPSVRCWQPQNIGSQNWVATQQPSWTSSKKNDEGQTTEISRIQRNIGGEMIIRPLSFQLFTTF